jgi:hypothetical protein
MDTSWATLFEPHLRLRWARAQRFPTATAAAESLGMKKDTYTAYERAPDASKHTKLDHQRAIQFAKKFKVSWKWLLTGEGSPMDEQLSAEEERVLSLMKGADEEAQRRVVDVLEAMLKRA